VTLHELVEKISHIENHAWDGQDDVVIEGLRDIGLLYVAEKVKDRGRLERASDILGDENGDNEEAIGLLITAGLVDVADVVRAWTSGRKRQLVQCKLIDQQLGVVMGGMRHARAGCHQRESEILYRAMVELKDARRKVADLLLQTEAT
jgi:fermentation-respiration switch protein FrsA (DUF1100 family)